MYSYVLVVMNNIVLGHLANRYVKSNLILCTYWPLADDFFGRLATNEVDDYCHRLAICYYFFLVETMRRLNYLNYKIVDVSTFVIYSVTHTK